MSGGTGKTRLIVTAIVGALVLGVAARFVVDRIADKGSAGVDSGKVTVSGDARIGGPFSLTDHTGRAVTERDFRGAFMLIYFGYTSCTDVCPADLQSMSDALDSLGPLADRVRPVFVSLDPERDTVAVLADYVSNFHPRLVALTGTAAQVAAAAKVFGIYFAKVRSRSAGGAADPRNYLMNHSSFIYLMGPDGKFRAAFRPGTAGKFMTRRIRDEIEAGGGA